MGRAAVAHSPHARDTFERIDRALGWSVSRLCFEGPADRLQETAAQQPAIFACSMALYAAWRAELPEGDEILCAAGHSLGEYGALVSAEALPLEDGARLVSARGQAMQEAADREPGGMCAVLGLDREILEAICAEVSDRSAGASGIVVLANDNAPGQQVLSGGIGALERASALARARGARRVVPLKVGGAFHSPLMIPAVPALETALRRLDAPDADAAVGGLRPCKFPVVANSSCESLLEPPAIREELLRQIAAPVRWVESIHAMADRSPDVWVDVGPGKVLGNLLARILPAAPLLSLADLIDSPVAVH